VKYLITRGPSDLNCMSNLTKKENNKYSNEDGEVDVSIRRQCIK